MEKPIIGTLESTRQPTVSSAECSIASLTSQRKGLSLGAHPISRYLCKLLSQLNYHLGLSSVEVIIQFLEKLVFDDFSE